MRESFHRLARLIDYQFENPEVIEVALTHRSAGKSNNERQEFLGDAILGFVIADELYHRFPDADEGQLSRLRAKLVKKESLAAIAKELELGSYLILGPGELRSGGHSRDSILADALEALLAAIYLDADYQQARTTITKLFADRINQISERTFRKDPKTRLQELLQSKRLPLPVYSILETSGKQHDQVFKVQCDIPDLNLESRGTGSSKRAAEQEAAESMLDLHFNDRP